MATRSVKCNLKNASGYPLALMDSNLIDGIIVPPGPPATIADGATGTWLAESDGLTSGTQGSVRYRVKDPHGSTFTVTWDNPFILGNPGAEDDVKAIIREELSRRGLPIAN